MIDVCNALPLICEWARVVKACPTIAVTFVYTARRTATTLIVWNKYRYRSTRRADEHIGLDGVLAAQVIGSVDAALGRLKSLARAICLNAAAAILDGDRALSYDVVYETGMIVPQTRDLADRRLERPGCQPGRAVPQPNVVARADPDFECGRSINSSDCQEADTDYQCESHSCRFRHSYSPSPEASAVDVGFGETGTSASKDASRAPAGAQCKRGNTKVRCG
jgi:hypothetical protein